MTKQEIIDYVMTTPSNPNKAVLEGMLDSIANAGGSTDEYANWIKIKADYNGEDLMTTAIFNLSDQTSALAFCATEVNTGENIQTISKNACAMCTKLETVIMPTVRRVDESAFAGRSTIKRIVAPQLNYIQKKAFAGVGNSETEIFISSDIDWDHVGVSFDASAFAGFSGILNCGFAEGQVSGAPWGAANATINYNVPAPKDV